MINNKFSILFVFLFVFSLMIFGIKTNAESNTCPTIAPYKCNNGSCVNTASLCDQSWGGGLSSGSSTSEDTQTSQPGNLLSPSLSTKCTGNLRVDQAATKECARLAEQQGKSLGYDMKCTTEKRTDVLAKDAAPIGERDAFFASCTINGVPGFDPVSLVGYQGSGAGITLYDNFLGTTQAYGAGYNVNSMWYALPCDLANSIDGTPGGGVLQGAVTCTKGAEQYFGSNNPANWTPSNAGKSTAGTGVNPSKTVTYAGVTNNTSGKTVTYAGTSAGQIVNATFNSQAMEVVKRMLEVARNLYGQVAIQNRAIQNNSGKTSSSASSTLPRVDAHYTVTADKKVYCVGETPLYTLTGGADLVGKQILWSSFKDGISTNEFDNNYGHILTQKGTGSAWSDYGYTWNVSHIGKWKKEANVSGLLNTVEFEVKYCSAPQTTTVSCFPDTIRVPKYRIAFFSATNGDATFSSTYDWSAPQATRATGQGRDFATTYANAGTYNVTVKVGDKTDVCQVVVTN